MSSVLSSQGMVLATAMAVSGTVILLAFRLQKYSPSTSYFPLPQSCIISSDGGNKKKEKKKTKKKKVHFAEDVVDPIGNSDEYRKLRSNNISIKYSKRSVGKVQEMPANRLALYNGMLRERVMIQRVGYSC